MELNPIKDAFDRVAKKQKLSFSKSQEVIDQLDWEIEHALGKLQSADEPDCSVNQKSLMMELNVKLNAVSPQSQLEGSQKELNMNFSKYAKLLEKAFSPNISRAYRNVDFDFHTVNHIIANHFYQQGLFDLGDCLIEEAGEPEGITLKSCFIEMYQIVNPMREDRNLKPALNWVSCHRDKLQQSSSDLELKLHRLQFVEILQKGTQLDALNYARTYLAPFASLHLHEIQKLMACLLWAGKLDRSPYSELMAPTHWENVTEDLKRQFCNLLGTSSNSPLNVAISAGVQGLPTLIKLASVMATKKQEWQAMKHLPVPVDLGREFQFHSVFVCPVSRDQGSEENPPMLMPCGHVLCRQSITKLSKSSNRNFKCPYCPLDSSVAQCR